jgi:two-component system CheB/CheR fusion protein
MAKRNAATPRKSAAPKVENAKADSVPSQFPIVGVGGSVGGLEAITELLKALPRKPGIALIFVSHLDPGHPSILAELLGRSTEMWVTEAVNKTAVKPNHVYVIPPNFIIEISDGTLRLRKRPLTPHGPMLIDTFLCSLAADRKSRAIGVVLSGSGTDGTEGLRAIKSEGGITFAQDPSSAKGEGMPKSALLSGAADYVLPVAEIARELIKLVNQPYLADPAADTPEAVVSGPNSLSSIFDMLRNATGVDFTSYKHPTIRRRIGRRMVLKHVEHVDSYVKLLKTQPGELEELYRDLLINVTGFFRDPDTFAALRTLVFPEVVKGRPPDSPIRIWIPGCSTGEEAYSIAIALVEFLQDSSKHFPIQIFATDVSDSTIEKARSGLYGQNIENEVSPERLKRFFTSADRGYQIMSSIREMCVFARQNITKDPPFSKLDLISCRNVLIYLAPTTQHKVMSVFHYALKPHGYLVLGTSETIGGFTDLFGVVEKKARVYRRKTTTQRAAFDISIEGMPAERPEARRSVGVESGFDVQRQADRIVLAHYAPPGVVVNEDLKILAFRGQTGDYLQPAPGEASLNLLKMVREGLLLDLRSALYEARKKDVTVRKTDVRVRTSAGFRTIDVEVVPIRNEASKERHFLVLFQPSHSSKPARDPKPAAHLPRRSGDQEAQVRRLHDELASTKEYLQAHIEELEATNEELKSANEEIQSSNEELQSTNEELETAKEELQSTNEELTTVNEELQNRNIELSQANNDLSNVLINAGIPVVILDNDLRIRRYTPMAERVLNLIPSDVGRHVTDLKPNIEVSDLEPMLLDVTRTLRPCEQEVRDRQGRWYNLLIRPYRTTESRIEGAVLVLVDIDALKKGVQQIEESRQFAQAIVETIREGLVVLDSELRVRSANRCFYQIFRTTPKDTEGCLLWELGGGEWRLPSIETFLTEVLTTATRVQELEIEQDFPHLGRRWMQLTAYRLQPAASEELLLLAIEDTTDRRARYRQIFESAKDAIVVADAQTGRVTDVNPATVELLGYTRNELLGKRLWETGMFQDADSGRFAIEEAKNKNTVRYDGVTLARRDHQKVEAEVMASVFGDGGRQVVQFNLRDVTERRRIEEQVRSALKEKEIHLQEVHHRVKNNLQVISSLLNLQVGYSADPAMKDVLGQMRTRVHSIATVHEMLHSAGFPRIDLREYVQKLAKSLFESYEISEKRVSMSLDVSPHIVLELERAVPFGLLLNELLSNSLKHAFPGGRPGEITIEIKSIEGGQCGLQVSDNGIGLSPGFDMTSTSSLGMQLVQLLSEQLKGSVSVSGSGGATFSVTFPCPA